MECPFCAASLQSMLITSAQEHIRLCARDYHARAKPTPDLSKPVTTVWPLSDGHGDWIRRGFYLAVGALLLWMLYTWAGALWGWLLE